MKDLGEAEVILGIKITITFIRLNLSRARTKKLPISVDFSAKNRILVVLEKILGWKNRV